jgi:mRNA interferase MazF
MARLKLQAFDTVVVPFPFTDRAASKRRPALVVSDSQFNLAENHSVLAMITSAEQTHWLADYSISNIRAAGLSHPCVVRMKLFTLDHRLILRIAGALSVVDQKQLRSAWKGMLVV